MSVKQKPINVDFEIFNIEPVNKYISECEIKVFHTGQNRNGSYISKATGNEIAKTLPRTPIVAFYNEEIGDYRDHGEEITINGDGVKIERKTVPFGAVDEFTPATWKTLLDNRGQEQEYLVVRGYLWTGRYPHLQSVIDNGKGQSMEFYEESVKGNWAKFDNQDNEIFIINEADISALCILGDDVEPCFPQSSIGKPEMLYSLNKDNFKTEFNLFMFDLKEALKEQTDYKEGGERVKKEEMNTEKDNKTVEDYTEEENLDEEKTEDFENIETPEEEEVKEDFSEEVETETEDEVENETDEQNDNEFENLKADYEALKDEMETLKGEFAALSAEKQERDRQEKLEICDTFEALGEEVIKEFKDNIDKYSIEELDKELSAIAFKKGISFSLLQEESKIVTHSVVETGQNDVPAWVQAIKKKENNL